MSRQEQFVSDLEDASERIQSVAKTLRSARANAQFTPEQVRRAAKATARAKSAIDALDDYWETGMSPK